MATLGCVGVYWSILERTGLVGVYVPPQKGKSRGAGARSKLDKTRTPSRAPSKKAPGRASTQLTPPPEEEPQEPLDVEPILDDLVDRVLTACALAAAIRQRVPFTVSRARDAILFVAEWRFLVRDDGDPDRAGDPDPERDGVWSEDEEPQTSHWDSCTPGVVHVADVPPPSEEVSCEDLSVASEAEECPLVCPDEAPDAVSLLSVPGEVPSPSPPCLSPFAESSDISIQIPVPPISPWPPGRGYRRSLPPRPRTPAPPRAAPSEPAARASRQSRRGTVPPPSPASRISPASVQPRRSSRGTGLLRLSARRDASRWLLPEVKVIDVTTEPERVRQVGTRSRLIPSGTRHVLPVAARAPRGQPQLCDPWLASARLAPGVTVRWGGSERRGPALAGRGGHGEGEQEEDEAVRRAEKELKPILPTPESRILQFSDGDEQLEDPLRMRQLLDLPLSADVPAKRAPPAYWGPTAPRIPREPEVAPSMPPCSTPGAGGSLLALLKKAHK